ncbi:MAG TPA: hypothetical protein VMB50_05125 [Myxococcales bacterium]|nr:hypothetical protein [Myxococcales bacterium]
MAIVFAALCLGGCGHGFDCDPGAEGVTVSEPFANPDGGPPLVTVSGPECTTGVYALEGHQLVWVVGE